MMKRALSAAAPLIMLLSACGSEPETPSASTTPGAEPQAGQQAATPAVAARPVAFSQCASCHAVEPGKNGIGPSLAGVVGAKAAHDPAFAYSTPMRQSGLTWDEATLDRYLKDPRGTVPGTKMAYAGLKDDAKRAELIAWLKTI